MRISFPSFHLDTYCPADIQDRFEPFSGDRVNVVSLSLLSAGIFASTNVDDLFVLVGFFSDRSLPRRHIIAGQVVGIASLVGISLAAAFAALSISPARVGLLGVAPVIIGIMKPLRLHKSVDARQGRSAGVLQVAAITIANGGDNIGVYTPIFANQRPIEMSVTVAVFAALTLVWCLVALLLVRYPAIGRPVRRYGRLILPIVLIDRTWRYDSV
jgi:cadmium resistance protein CadD (predicted permease)